MNKLSHLDEHGAARMVDVSAKETTDREAVAEAFIVLSQEAFEAALSADAPKGDVLAAARLAGIMAAKKTPDLIPLCHQIALTKVGVDFEPDAERNALRIVATAKTSAQTGVEMEALVAASVAALTVYDMVKAIDHGATIENVRLVTKTGGKSGTYIATKRAVGAQRPRPTTPRGRAAPATLMGEVAGPRQTDGAKEREAFRAFMTNHRLRATDWAKQAGIPAALIYAFLTGRARSLPADAAEKLARAARVRIEDLFGKGRR
ncbi:MAG: cyclic pyranopterin monophosphate synthase MoaC [Proteobacteria bacterium]|nr:cyclic pyranopterin monophosphate synthase MoaC [Pseudomonadota bacterium]